MKINLIPTSHPELNTIEIDSDVFIIGRVEEPFLSYDTEITADISRNHAKIFTDNGQLFITDLESLNGTTINDVSLGSKPLALKNGDIVVFAKHLAYKVELINPDLEATLFAGDQQKNSLTLEPIDKTSGLDILSITGFPFLISKEAGVFTSFKKNFATETSRISRRHAYIILENQQVKLVDMSSTNGTYINKERLENNQPAILKNGDIVSFAGDFFTYIVKLDLAGQPNIEETIIRPEDSNSDNDSTNIINNEVEPKTMFVNEPTPFLDILCEEGQNASSSEENMENHSIVNGTEKPVQKKTSFIVSFIQQCRAALADEQPKKSKKKMYLISLALVCIISATAYLYLKDKTHEIKKLIISGKYPEAASLSKELLKSDPTNSALMDLSTTAILNQLVSTWSEQLEKQQYSKLEQNLNANKQSYLNNPEISKSIIMLQWVSDIRQYMSDRSKNDSIEIFKDENKIQALISNWNDNQKDNRKTLAMIARKVSAFTPYYEQVLSDIRLLENDQNLYLKAIDTLNKSLEEQLNVNQTENLHTTVTQFENKYSAVTGLDDLKLDIYHYLELNDALIKKNIERISILQKQNVFKTPLFIKHSQRTFSKQLPSEQFIEQYYESLKSWKKGDTETAISKLRSLSEGKWASFVEKKLNHYQSLITKFSELKQSKGSNKYTENLFNFHALLNIPEDHYFLNLIEQDFKDNEKLAIDKANNTFEQARVLWSKYQDNNGIGGILRLEKEVTEKFESQAKNLSYALQNIIYSQQIYKNLHVKVPLDINNLFMEINNEAEKQRKWLIDLELILKPETLKKKLDLLSISEEPQ